MYDKIKNSTLPDNMKDELQILREDTYIRLTLENNNDQNRLFDNLKREIEMTEQENAIKLIQDGVMFQRIKNSGLSYNNIKELQRLRDEKLVKLRAEWYERAIKLVGSLNNEQELNNLYSEITKDDILTDTEKYNIKKLIENKINLLRQKIEFEFLKDRISKERDLVKLSVDWNNAIIDAKHQNANQKNKLEMIRLERLKELRGLKAFEDIKKAIENERFLSNLFDGNVH